MPSISALGSVSFAWLHAHAGFSFEESYFLDPAVRFRQDAAINSFLDERFPNDPVYNFEAGLVQAEGRTRPVMLVGGLQPNLILGAALGAQFVFYGDKDPDITPAPLADADAADRLRQTDWAQVWPVELFLRQLAELRESGPPGYALIPPFFWDVTGRATIHGVLTTAQKLVGEQVFVDIMERPDSAFDLLEAIADAYERLIRLCSEAAGLPVTGLHVGECSGCMIGPEAFEAFVLPVLNRMADRIGPVRLHTCGPSDHLIESFTKVRRLAALNVGSGTSVRSIRRHLPDLRIDVIPDTTWITSQTMREVGAWVRATIDENAGGPLQFQYHIDLGQPVANFLQIHRTLRELGFECGRRRLF